ncbi:MAG: hypothetical protein M1388_02465 [Thaumarchaeota archaeon]|nr:hypothetical protein [Nitrososphaerota archaeon]
MKHFPLFNAGYPLRLVLTAYAITVIFSYGLTIIYSLFIGPDDFAIPVKISYIALIGILLFMVFQEIRRNIGLNNLNLGQSFLHMAIELPSAVSLIIIGRFFILTQFALVNLTLLNFIVRVLSAIGIAMLFAFGILAIFDLVTYQRREGLHQLIEV